MRGAVFEKGDAKGSEHVAKLSAILVEKVRYEDIVRMSRDEAFLEQLFAEFELV